MASRSKTKLEVNGKGEKSNLGAILRRASRDGGHDALSPTSGVEPARSTSGFLLPPSPTPSNEALTRMDGESIVHTIPTDSSRNRESPRPSQGLNSVATSEIKSKRSADYANNLAHGVAYGMHKIKEGARATGDVDLQVIKLGFQKEVSVALTSFEKAAEWADLSSALGRFAKVLAALPPHFDLADFDNDRIIYRRLAQCLNRALPAGVHLKVCEIYDHIMKHQDQDAIIRNLGMFTIGIFPVLTYAASPVRVAFFKVMKDEKETVRFN